MINLLNYIMLVLVTTVLGLIMFMTIASLTLRIVYKIRNLVKFKNVFNRVNLK